MGSVIVWCNLCAWIIMRYDFVCVVHLEVNKLYMYGCMYLYTCICMWGHVYNVCVCVWISTCVFGCMSQRYKLVVRSKSVTGDTDPIRIRVHYGLNTMAIRKLTHGMTWRFVPVCTVKTRRRFGSKIVSFHVSVCSCIISLFTLVSRYLYVTCIISCDYLMYFTSMINCISSWDIIKYSLWLCSWSEYLTVSFHV